MLTVKIDHYCHHILHNHISLAKTESMSGLHTCSIQCVGCRSWRGPAVAESVEGLVPVLCKVGLITQLRFYRSFTLFGR